MVSIIVPVYNSEECLRFCIDSIITQTWRDIEIILVDDGSTDKSGEICDEYAKKDSRIRVIHTEHGGVSRARNKGIYSASGKYILFCDSDDFYKSDYVSTFMSAKQAHPEYTNIWCGFVCANCYKNEALLPSEFANEKKYVMLTTDDIMRLVKKWLNSMIWNKLFERDIIIQSGLKMDEEMNLGEDLIFALDYLDATNSRDILFINKPLYVHVKTGKPSLNNMYHENRVDMSFKMNGAMEKYFTKWEVPQSVMREFYSSAFYRLESTMLSVMSKKNSQSFLKKLGTNRRIMNSREFKRYLNGAACRIHPLYKLFYKLSCYLPVHIMNKLKSSK